MKKYYFLISFLFLSLNSFSQLISLPFEEDFESGQNGWTTGGTNNTWAFGTPNKLGLNSAPSGGNAWVLGGLAGYYGGNELSYVQSPAYDFTGVTEAKISATIAFDIQVCCNSNDGMLVQYSVDAGTTWEVIPASTNSINWYDQQWTGESNGLIKVTSDISSAAGEPEVFFRFLFNSDRYYPGRGFVLDDFTVSEYSDQDLLLHDVDIKSSRYLTDQENINMVVYNAGKNTVSNFDLSYEINQGPTFTESFNVAIPAFTYDTISFSTTSDLSAETDYYLKAWTSLPSDILNFNDTLSKKIKHISVTSPSLPYEVGFNDQFNISNYYSTPLIPPYPDFELEVGDPGTYHSVYVKRFNSPFSTFSAYLWSNSNTQSLIGHFDLSELDASIDNLLLSFRAESSSIVELEVRANNASGWQSVHSIPASSAQSYYFNISEILNNNSLNFSPSTQIKFSNPSNNTFILDNFRMEVIQSDDLETFSYNLKSERDLTNTESLSTKVYNSGWNSQSNVEINYQINESAPVSEVLASTIAFRDTLDYTFSTLLDLSADEIYNIKVWTSLAGDEDLTNDTVSFQVENIARPLLSLPYSIDFEDFDQNSWYGDQLAFDPQRQFDFITDGEGYLKILDDWNEMPSKGLVLGSQNGLAENELILNLNLSDYTVGTNDIAFDFDYYKLNTIHPNPAKIYIRGNKNNAWIEVFDFLSEFPNRRNHISIAISDSLAAYGQDFSLSTQVKVSQTQYDLISDGGLLLDNIKVYQYLSNDLTIFKQNLKSSRRLDATQTLRATINNRGAVAQQNFDIFYRINGGVSIQETVTASVEPFDNYLYNFTTNLDLSTVGIYDLEIWTDLSTEEDRSNDTLKMQLEKYPNPVVTLPFLVDFNDYPSQELSGDTLLFGKDSIFDFYSHNGNGQLEIGRYGRYLEDNNNISISSTQQDVNNLVLNLNLQNYQASVHQIYFEFDYINLRDDEDPEDLVYIRGNDGNSWVAIYDWNDSENYSNNHAKINISDSLIAHGQELSSSTQIKFVQKGNEPLESGGIKIDNLNLFEIVPTDLSVISSFFGNKKVDFSSGESLTVQVKNLGYEAQSGFDIFYQIGEGAPVQETISNSVNQDDTISYTFNNTLDLSEEKRYEIKVWTDVDADTTQNNDTLIINTLHTPFLNLPYRQDFEIGDPLWEIGGTNPSWEIGIPSKLNYSLADGNHAFVLGTLNGNYNSNENSYLYTPYYNFADLDTAFLAFDLNHGFSGSGDILKLQYTTDKGASWNDLTTGLENWHTGEGWRYYSGQMERAIADITPLSGNMAVQFRFYFKRDGYDVGPGAIIDNVEIKEYDKDDIAPISTNLKSRRSFSSQEQLTVDILNSGFNTQNDFDIYYQVGSDSPIKESVGTTVAFEDSISYTFTNTLDLSSDGSYQISVWTELLLDQDPDNDTLNLVVEKYPNPMITLPYTVDFENLDTFFHDGDTLLFGDMKSLDFMTKFGNGQVQVFTGTHAIDNKSLSIASSNEDLNEFIINLNLSKYSIETGKVLMDFDYRNVDDELDEEDKVYVRGSNKDQWLELYDWNTGEELSNISVSSIDIGALLKANEQDFSQSSQIKFSQSDNFSFGDDGLVIDNIKFYEENKNDVGVISSNLTRQSGGFTDQETLSVEIGNFAFNDQQSFDIYYQVDDLIPVQETFTQNITQYDTMSFSFNTPLNLSEEKNYQIKVWSALEADTVNTNDSLTFNVTHMPAEDLPYLEDFDNDDGAWVSGGASSSWSYGIPAKSNLNHNSKAWVLGGLSGTYNNGEKSYLISPLMNLSNLDTGYISLDINYQIENYYDVLKLQYSTDNGSTWSNLTSNKIQNYSSSGWEGESDSLLNSQVDISHLGGLGSVKFRFYFQSDNVEAKDGAIIDNIEIKSYPSHEISPVNVNLKSERAKTSNETITVEVVNNGLDPQSNFDITYRLNGGSIVKEVVNTNLQSLDTMSYSFSNLVNLSQEGIYTLDVWTTLPDDQNKSNDSLSVGFELYPNTLIELPLEITFDDESAFLKKGDTILFGKHKLFDFFTANENGQVQVFTGSNAIDNKSLGIASSGYDSNELIVNLNLYNYTVEGNKLLFNFDFKDLGGADEEEDKVLIRGSQNDPWVILYDWNTANNYTTINASLNISDSLLAMGQEFSNSTQIKFAQSGYEELGFDGLVIDNLSINELSSDDVGVVSTTLDPSGIFTESESLNVNIFNYGYEAKQGFDIYYQVDSGQIVQETVSSEISAFDSLNYTFNTLIDLYEAKTYQIKVWTNLPNDVNQNNDTLIFNVEQIQVLQLPYFQDFENGDGNWVSGGNNSSWEYGVPNKLSYDSTQNNKAWALGGLDSTYNNREQSYIESPLVNFAGQDSLFLSADINYDLESGWDELKVQYSSDQGGTWNDLNAGLSNWFSGGGWSGLGEIMVITDVSELSAFEYVKFRFYFESDGGFTKSGAVIDNIVIKPYEEVDLILNDYNISTLNDAPGSAETIEVSVFNRGQEFNGAVIEYSLNNQQVYQDTVNVISAFETQTITLSNTLDFTMQCTNQLRISLIAENDSDQTNNIIEDTVYTNSDPIGNLIIADSMEVCINEGILQLESEINNGTWTGNGVSESGEFDPEVAGVGLHEILFETYEEGCRNYDSLIIEVESIILGTIDKSVEGQLTAPQASSYHWLKDGAFINETSQTIEIQSSGDYAVQLTNEAGCISIIEAGQVLSSNNRLGSNFYKVYPNPARDYLMINVSSELSDVKAQLFSFKGKLLWERPIVDNEIRMELNNRFSGTYILKLISNEGIATEKIILF